jgi:endonuclease-3
MARRSPRSRRKPADSPRLPGKNRPRATPGRRKRAAAGAPKLARKAGHAPKGARLTAVARATAASRAAAKRARPKAARRPLRPRARTARASAPPDPARVGALLAELKRLYPQAHTELRHDNPLQLLVATILSAQCTDERVNLTTPALFARCPDAAALAAIPRAELEALIRSTGFYRMKARAIQECCADIGAKHGGAVPRTMEELTALRGVGRKTANVVLGNAYGIPGLVVDTHVHRLSNRLGLTNERDPVRIEFALMPVVPRERWTVFSHWLILHGRRVCNARKPRCASCALAPHCPRLGVTASQ